MGSEVSLMQRPIETVADLCFVIPVPPGGPDFEIPDIVLNGSRTNGTARRVIPTHSGVRGSSDIIGRVVSYEQYFFRLYTETFDSHIIFTNDNFQNLP